MTRARPARVRARTAARLVPLALLLALPACRQDAAGLEAARTDADVPEPAGPLPKVSVGSPTDGVLQLLIPTYDGSGESVEPAVLHFAGGWHGWSYWMAQTPYPHGNQFYENPSIVVGGDGLTWRVPDGLTNPVAPEPAGPILHNSDPELIYLPQQDRLLLFYRAVTRTQNVLFGMTSRDGVHWSGPVRVLDAPNHSLVSPALVLAPGRRPKLYAIDAGPAGCVAQATRVVLRRWTGTLDDPAALTGAHWSDPVVVDLQGPPGWLIWHLHVIFVGERQEYWAAFPAYPVGGNCSGTDLFVGRSRDGVHWQVLGDPVLRRGAAPWADSTMYRASIEYLADRHALRVWFSALGAGAWHIGHQVLPIADLVDAMDGRIRPAAGPTASPPPGRPVSAPSGLPAPLPRTGRQSRGGVSPRRPDALP